MPEVRLIDANALKVHMCNMCDGGDRECKGDESCALLVWVSDMPTIKSAPKWIPCNERLPEKHGEYLVCFGIGMYESSLNGTDLIDKRFYGEKSDGTVGWHSLCSSDITHWMPLPANPMEDHQKVVN